ncbi:MAG: hypothetical protein HRU20_16015 [Pseudomonadales bacterium]|nr:hypothetical protein [Pseudomonadales bacterium]
MNSKSLFFVFFIITSIGGCGSVSSSSARYVSVSEQTKGPIDISRQGLPKGSEYEVIGIVKANAREGYDSVESLYPLLVEEARKVGADAIINVYGGRTTTAFSWSAPYAGGTAVKIKNSETSKTLYKPAPPVLFNHDQRVEIYTLGNKPEYKFKKIQYLYSDSCNDPIVESNHSKNNLAKLVSSAKSVQADAIIDVKCEDYVSVDCNNFNRCYAKAIRWEM